MAAAAAKAAALVAASGAVQHQQVPPASKLSVDQKKKLLWGGKKKEAEQEQSVFGHNRWDRAEFTSEQERLKFIKMMGGKAAAEMAQQGPANPAAFGPAAFGPAFGPAPGPAFESQQAGAEPSGLPGFGPALPEGSGGGDVQMGGEMEVEEAVPGGAAGGAEARPAAAAEGPDIMKREEQAKVLGQLEREFHSGLRRQLAHRTAGLGGS